MNLADDTITAADVILDLAHTADTALLVVTCDRLRDEHGTDLAELVRLLAAAHEIRRAATDIVGAVEQAVLGLLPDYDVRAVEGVGTVARRGGTTRKRWDHPRLWSLVAQRARESTIDPETGERIGDPVHAVVSALQDAAGISYWRVGALRGLGLNPDAFADVERGPDRIDFQPAGGDR